MQGVWEVDHSELLTESAVARAVRGALARDRRTTQAAIDVTCVGGTVTLLGQVRTPAEKAAAVEIARSVKGVVAVISSSRSGPMQSPKAGRPWQSAYSPPLGLQLFRCTRNGCRPEIAALGKATHS